MINLSWKNLSIEDLSSKLDIVKQAKTDGSNNQPTASEGKPSQTEADIINRVKNHYSDEIQRSQDTILPYEKTLRACNELTASNGHTQLFNRVQASWDGKYREYELRLNTAKRDLTNSIEAIRTFRIQENIPAGRSPKVRSTLKLVLSCLLLIAMAATEIFMNTQLLKEVVGGGEGLTISTIVSFFNVAVSFLIARLCLTHLINPVSASSSKGSYIFFTTIGGIVIIYINFMMGVYRGLVEKANDAGDMTQYLILSQQAAVEAVFPFNNLEVITFQSSFLMVVGFSFAFVSLLDGYFFDDPINGYGARGRTEISCKEKLKSISDEGPKVIESFVESAREELEEKRDSRLEALDTWSGIINELDMAQGQFDTIFNPSIQLLLETAIDSYRTNNITFRTEPNPVSFSHDIDTGFIKPFAENHPSIAFDLRTDPERVEEEKEKSDLINREWASTDDLYTEFFAKERDKIYALLN